MVTITKKIIFILLLFITFFLRADVLYAQVNLSDIAGQSYVIESFESIITINKNTNVDIVEEIRTNFYSPKHGIYRTIPISYSNKLRTINTRIHVNSVKDQNGDDYQYSLNRSFGQLQLKIGDPDTTLSGPHVYIISYTISDVIQRYADYDEFYWNVVGSKWDTDILSARVSVKSDFAKIKDSRCFAGDFGTNQMYCTEISDDSSANVISTIPLGANKDLTIVVAFDNVNQFSFPGTFEKMVRLLIDNWGYVFSIIPFIFIFMKWRKGGRDSGYASDNVYYKPVNVKTETVSFFRRKFLPMVYHPIDGLSPSEIGTIIDERVDISDIVAEIVELARLGFFEIRKLTIKKIIGSNTDYAFVKKKSIPSKDDLNLKDYQQYLLKELFRKDIVHDSVSIAEKYFKNNDKDLNEARKALIDKNYVLLSALKKKFYKRLPVFREKLYKRMADEGFFENDPEKERIKWLIIASVLEFISIALIIVFTLSTFNLGPLFVTILLIIPTILFALSMPKRTARGYSLYRQITGLKYFVGKGKWRYEVQEKQMFLEEMLPLAISLGVVNKLTKDMEELGIEKPNYIAGAGWTSFSSDFASFQTTSSSAIVTVPSSGRSSWSGGSGFSGGGSSGGGFGGGGGGSW
jgi:hypothetical protein